MLQRMCTCAWVRMSTLLHVVARSHEWYMQLLIIFLLRSSHSLAWIVLHYAVDQWPVGDRQSPGKLLFFTPKRNERETWHVLAAATRLHLPPEATRNLVELVRSRQCFTGVENRPHLFQWWRREKILGEKKRWNVPSTEQQRVCSCDIRSTVLYVWVRLHLPLVESPLQTDISGLCFSRPSPPTATSRELLPKHWLFK